MMRIFRSAILCLILWITIFSPAVSGFAMETPFADVPQGHPQYDPIHDLAHRNIILGTGNNRFSPDAPVTTQQWAIMLCRAYKADLPVELPFQEACLLKAYQNGWITLEALLVPDTPYCRSSIYESVFAVLDIHIYDHCLYNADEPLSPRENHMSVACEVGLCHTGADPLESVTRGEAAFLLCRMLTADLEVKEPPILREFPLENPSNVNMNAFLLELLRVPPPILQRFQSEGWVYAVDFAYLEDLSTQYDITCIGATSYRTKHIYVAEAGATAHEFGHFLQKELGDSPQTATLFDKEAANTAVFLRDYARKNHREYFAEYFAYWLKNHEHPPKAVQMEVCTPQTYAFFCRLAEDGWLPS